MTLDVSRPFDTEFVSQLPLFIRETRVEVNTIGAGGATAQTNLTIGAGVTSLSVGTDLSVVGLETIVVTGTGIAALETILGGSDGQIKIFIFQDTNVDLVNWNVHDTSGKFLLNHLPVGVNFTPKQDDVIALRNVSGDGAADHGYWLELYRTIRV